MPTPFVVCTCVGFCLYGPFNYISLHKFSWQLSVFSLCSSGLISALLLLSTVYIPLYESLLQPSPDVILCGWLGWKHQLTNSFSSDVILCGWLGSKHQLTYSFSSDVILCGWLGSRHQLTNPLSPDVILCGWLGSKHQLTNPLSPDVILCGWLGSKHQLTN